MRKYPTRFSHYLYLSSNITDMKAIAGTQQIFQVDAHSTKREEGNYCLDIAKYSCSCSQCREHSGVDTCLHENDRHVKTVCAKEKEQVAT